MKRLPECLTKLHGFVEAEGGSSKFVEAIFFAPKGYSECRSHGQRAWMDRRHIATARAMGWTLVVLREADEMP